MAFGDEDVLRLDVAVNDPEAVGVLEGARHFTRHRQGLPEWQLPLSGHPLAQRLALDERHDEVQQPVGLAGGEHGNDVGVGQRGGGVHLSQEAFAQQSRRHVRRQDLDGDLSSGVVFLGQEHRRHTTAPDLPLDGIAVGQRRFYLRQEVFHLA